MSLTYDPRDAKNIADPLPVLLALQEQDPVHWSASLGGWVITRYDDVKRIALDSELSADRLTPFFKSLPAAQRNRLADLIRYLNTWVAFRDPPEHTRLRKLMNEVFTEHMVETLKPSIETIVAKLLGDLAERERFDFISDFANPLPATVIMDMMGIPHEDLGVIKEWSNKIQLFIGSASTAQNKYQQAQEGAVDMADYFRAIIRERERKPADDIVSQLLAIRDEDDALSEDEVIGTCILFLFAGHETTTNLLGNGIRALIDHPDQLAKLRKNPQLIEPAVEECLRYDGPTGAIARVVAVEHEMGGKTLAKGDRVFAFINAANWDPRHFNQPQRFDITRTPNRHLTFNYGRHFCLGAPLARLEGQIAILEVVKRFPGLQLEGGPPQYMDTLVMRGVRKMPVRKPHS